MEIETRILNDRAEDEEEKEEASRWTGLSVQSVSLDWFGAWQAPEICWLQSSAVASVTYSSPAWAVDPTVPAHSLHCPSQAPWFILCHPSGWTETTGTGEQPM